MNPTPKTHEFSHASARGALDGRHLRELHEGSGIPLELIAEENIRTVNRRSDLVELGFTADKQQNWPAIVFDVHPPDGSNHLAVIKPDRPRSRADKPDKFIKYEWPAGRPHRLDVPLRCMQWLSDPTVPVFVVEGKKKALAILAHYLARGERCVVICLWGVWAWGKKPDEHSRCELLPDWELIPLDGRQVHIVFDSDREDKPEVDLGARQLAARLAERGAEVYHVILPGEPDGSKNGADDLLVRHGGEAFDQCVEAAIDRGPHGTEGLRAAWRRQRARIRELEQERSSFFAVLRNGKLSATQRIAAVFTVFRVAETLGHPDREAPVKITVDCPKDPEHPENGERAGLAAEIGLSPSTVRRVHDDLFGEDAAPGAPLSKKTEDLTNELGRKVGSYVTFTPTCTAAVPGMLQLLARHDPQRPKHGGKRSEPLVCPEDPFAKIHVRHTASCTVCGQVVDEKITTAPRPPVEQVANPVSAPLQVETSTPSRVRSVSKLLVRPTRSATPSHDPPRRTEGCRSCGGNLNATEIAAGFGLHVDCTLPVGAAS